MCKIPCLVEAVNEEVRAAVCHFKTREDGEADLLADLKRLFVVGKIVVDLFIVGQGAVNAAVSLDEVVGDEDAGVADLLVIVNDILGCCSAAEADRGGVQMRFGTAIYKRRP